jgi:predicted nuclease of predicted toxin-antitoxin system
MRVLLDECLPRRLHSHLVGHDAQTVQAMGWSGKKNGELLGLAAEAGFEVLITADQNMQYQQNLTSGAIGVISLVAGSIRLQDLLPLIPAVLTALDSIKPGALVEVGREGQDSG